MSYLVINFSYLPQGELIYYGNSEEEAIREATYEYDASEGTDPIYIFNNQKHPLEFQKYYRQFCLDEKHLTI